MEAKDWVITERPALPKIQGGDVVSPTERARGMLEALKAAAEDAKVQFGGSLWRRLLASLLSKRFVILTGLTGSGKTLSARLLATWLGPASLEWRRQFEPGEKFRIARMEYLVRRADSLSYEVWNDDREDEAVKILLSREVLDEWISYIEKNHVDESIGSLELRDAVQEQSRWSNNVHSFHAPLKAAAFSLLKKQPIAVTRSSDVLPVGADWTSRESLLGYPDALDSKRFVAQPALLKVLDACEDPGRPYFLILDEMNLSHVERYFADFLSAMESGEPIPLYRGEERSADGRPIPQELRLPDNLFVVGTVNVDETTYMFSPKVLDRAQVIEYRVEESEMERFLGGGAKPDLSVIAGQGSPFADCFLELARDPKLGAWDDEEAQRFASELMGFFSVLQRHGAEFGFRTAHEARRFASLYRILEPGEPGQDWLAEAMDCVVCQKLLPKLHGSRAKLSPILQDLWSLCLQAPESRSQPENRDVPDRARAREARYPLSADKIARMWSMLQDHGFASFAEA
ncbi:MAG: hypothetical protein N2109_12830 [Fimbriimonadales bacterium]|nr:hypothetical protein [Fimbriimonadales bacterium]